MTRNEEATALWDKVVVECNRLLDKNCALLSNLTPENVAEARANIEAVADICGMWFEDNEDGQVLLQGL